MGNQIRLMNIQPSLKYLRFQSSLDSNRIKSTDSSVPTHWIIVPLFWEPYARQLLKLDRGSTECFKLCHSVAASKLNEATLGVSRQGSQFLAQKCGLNRQPCCFVGGDFWFMSGFKQEILTSLRANRQVRLCRLPIRKIHDKVEWGRTKDRKFCSRGESPAKCFRSSLTS